jgi:hypothetical protein
MKLVQLSDGFIVNLETFREAIFDPGDGTEEAKLVVYFKVAAKTTFHAEEAIAAWSRLRDLAREGTADG